MEVLIPADDPVRLLSAFVEGMDLSDLYETYSRIRKNQATPRQMLKVVLYAAMNRIYSSREIESSCRRDINFMYLLEGMPVPDHATIARFVSLHFSECSKKILAEMTELLYAIGELSGKTIFIDGTKIESCANKYTFVWKKAVTKNQTKLMEKIERFTADCEELYGVRIVYDDRIDIGTLKRLRKQLIAIGKEEGIVFVHGIGRRKSHLQKTVEELDEYMRRLNDYKEKLERLGSRNSYSKTDPDATFMRMKEDAMKNGSDYRRKITIYGCSDCGGCPYKTACIHGNNSNTPMEDRNKVLQVSKKMLEYRAKDLERITGEYGTQLRVNRSIQAEGSFADVKEDMNFRRYLYRGRKNALAQSILLAMGRNINKLHFRIQSGRTGLHLFEVKSA